MQFFYIILFTDEQAAKQTNKQTNKSTKVKTLRLSSAEVRIWFSLHGYMQRRPSDRKNDLFEENCCVVWIIDVDRCHSFADCWQSLYIFETARSRPHTDCLLRHSFAQLLVALGDNEDGTVGGGGGGVLDTIHQFQEVRPTTQRRHPAPRRTTLCRSSSSCSYRAVVVRHSAATTCRRLWMTEEVSERLLEEIVCEAVDERVDSAVRVAEHSKQLKSVDLPSL